MKDKQTFIASIVGVVIFLLITLLSNIDVIMCEKNNNILYYYNNLSKNRIILPKKNVFKTIELPVNYFDIKIGNKIEIKINN